MERLPDLAQLLKQRNNIEEAITAIIARPASIGHLGEYIASRIFGIQLHASATHPGSDGIFTAGPLAGHTVNVKCKVVRDGTLDIEPRQLPDYYLVLTGPSCQSTSSRNQSRPWCIHHVYLFEAQSLLSKLEERGVTCSSASSVCKSLWADAEIYPTPTNTIFPLTDEQVSAFALFRD